MPQPRDIRCAPKREPKATDGAEIVHLREKLAVTLSALKFIKEEFKEFLNDDAHSRRVRDRIDAAIARAEQ